MMYSNSSSNEALSVLAADLKLRSQSIIILESTLFTLLEAFTLVGNFLTLYIIYINKRLRTPTNLLVASLAVSDFAMGALSMHLLVTVLLTSEWPFGEIVCQYQGFISIVLAAASTQTLAWTAVNRYFSVVKTRLYRRYFTTRKTSLIVCQIWFMALTAPFPYLSTGNTFVFNPGKFFCYLRIDVGWFTALLVGVYVGLPSMVIAFCYFRVYQIVRKHNSKFTSSLHRHSHSRVTVEEIKITHTLFVIVIVFMCCWTPVLVMDVIDTFGGKWTLPRAAYVWYTFLATFSNAVNPVIYGVMNKSLRKGYLDILLCRNIQCRTYEVRQSNHQTETRPEAIVISKLTVSYD